MFRIRFCFAFLAASVWGQECRLTGITPAQPPNKVEEGERATESQTYQQTALALSPENLIHFFDSAFRIRRIEANGRVTTLAGTGVRGDAITGGAALRTPLAPVSQIVFSPDGLLHFVSTVNGVSRVLRINGGNVELVAGAARPGFSGESGAALDVGLGTIVNVAFEHRGALLILDGYARVRRLEGGVLRTVAGSARAAAAAGFTGDNGPAVEASLSSPRQLYTFRDGSFWIRDLAGRHLRVVTPDGIIRTINQNFEATLSFLALGDGSPAGAVANRVFPLRTNGQLDTAAAANPFPPFTGTPLAVTTEGALLFAGNARPEQRNPLVRLANRVQTVVAGAPTIVPVDGQAPPFAVWSARTNSLIFAAERGDKFGVLEARAGQQPSFLAGGGSDVSDVEGKAATGISIFGVVAFSVDGEGRIVVADVYRRRILVIGADGKTSVLKTKAGDAVVFAPLGALTSIQRIAADNAGNIYWFSGGATPAGGVFTAEISVWTRATQEVTAFTVAGLTHIVKLEDGNAAVIAGNGANFRSVTRVSPVGLGATVPEFGTLPLVSVTRAGAVPYLVAASRLFRGLPGQLEMLDLPFLPGGMTFAPDFVMNTPEGVLVHNASTADGGFYRIDNPNACRWLPQPSIAAVVNAAGFGQPNTASPRQLITLFGTGLGPAEGQGAIRDGLLRAGPQAAPYPSMVLGNFSGAIPNATLTGTALPVLFSNDRQMTVQATTAATGTLRLYYTWQGLQLLYGPTVRAAASSPALFAHGDAAAALNEDGSVNGERNPAARGSVVQLYGTGFGAVDNAPALGDAFGGALLSRLTNPVSVTIGGAAAELLFAGGAPGTVGVFQLNVRLPEETGTGALPISVDVAGQTNNAQQVALWVK